MKLLIGIMFILLLSCRTTTESPNSELKAGNQAWVGADKMLHSFGVFEDVLNLPESTVNDQLKKLQQLFLQEEQNSVLLKKLIAENIYVTEDDPTHSKKEITFLRYGYELLEKTKQASYTLKVSSFYIAKRVLYTVISRAFVGRKSALGEKIVAGKDFFIDKGAVFPYPANNLDVVKKKASKESHWLVSPTQPDKFLDPAAFRALSHRDISLFDISPRHPVWYPKKADALLKQNWRDLESWIEQGLSKYLSEKRTPAKINYQITSAQRILFFKEVKQTATSPKIEVTDRYGLKWKMKWGTESQTEPIINRLYMRLGGKYADLTYAFANETQSPILILNRPISTGSPADTALCNPTSLQMLADCLLNSKYKFNINPYVIESGTMTKEVYNRFFSPEFNLDLPFADLENRVYVRFKTSMLEMKPSPLIVRGGPAANSVFGAQKDRVARGLGIFNMWVGNRDVKDENNKGLLLKNYKPKGLASYYEGQELSYVETHHDMGNVFGGKGEPGDLNAFYQGKSFAKVRKKTRVIGTLLGFKAKELFLFQPLIYYPKAWKTATHADNLWMVRKIAALTTEDLREVISYSKWPWFMQETLLWKLQARRDDLVALFRLEKEFPFFLSDSSHPHRDRTGPNLSLTLKQAISTYQLTEAELQMAFKERVNLTYEQAMKVLDLPEQLVVNGKIKNCHQSIILPLLEKLRFPSGLSRRLKRGQDHQGLDNCVYNPVNPVQ